MKWVLRALFIYLPALLLTSILGGALLVWQQNLVSRKDLADLLTTLRKHGIQGTLEIVQAHQSGTSPMATDPGYGRRAIAGRGHTPWVLRGNLDGKPRMLSFALAPGTWAAYDTRHASLYQVWQGEIRFQGAAYDYRHGPQPEASGAWYLRRTEPHPWYLRGAAAGAPLPARVEYLGHEYGPGQKTAGLRFALVAGALRVELTEYPELEQRDGQAYLLRQFRRHGGTAGVTAAYADGNGELTAARDTVRVPLRTATPIPEEAPVLRRSASDAELETGERVIRDGDCLGCHDEAQQVSGPSWSRVAGRYRGAIQDAPLARLARSILEGSSGQWGQLPMPAHPDLSPGEARAAATWILSRPESELAADPPTDEHGRPYPATQDFDVDPPPASVHPAFVLEGLLPEGFEPKVGGMDVQADGKLLVASWDHDGAVFRIDPGRAPEERVERIAEGLHEPLGLAVVGERLFVLQKQELTELVDRDGDGIVDEYRSFADGWPTSTNFHSFAFGLVHRGEFLYALLSICVLPGGASCPEQLPTQGKLLRIALADGAVEIVASGFRAPNGIGLGPHDELFVTDNQGGWLPSSKLVHAREGHFYGSRAVPDAGVLEAEETPPVVWLPQDEVGNSPTQPLLLREGPYAGQLIHGDVTHGGVKRVYLERVAGAWQGAVFHFSGGFQSGVNRLVRGPDGAIYVGEIGNPPNWSEVGKPWHGVERLTYRGPPAFELLEVQAEPDGFTLVLSEPVDPSLRLAPGDLSASQWFYHPTEQYGGPKYDAAELPVTALELAPDRRRIAARIPGRKAGYVVYLRLDPRIRSSTGRSLWVGEAWYTLNAIPGAAAPVRAAGSAQTQDAPGGGA